MSVIRRIGGGHGISKVKIIHHAGTEVETVVETEALIQDGSGFFEMETPIHEGDIVEVPDPRKGPDGTERRLAKQLKVNSFGQPGMRLIQVKWGPAP